MNHPAAWAEEGDSSPRALVVMGVCGAGKTEISRRLADALHWIFIDADDFHPPANVKKMRAGTPLTDADRWPWLDALAATLRDAVAGRGNTIMACSALAHRYRVRLGLPHPLIRLVHLDDAAGVIRERMERRTGHFMPTALLDSQLALLEKPTADERPIIVDVAGEPRAIVRTILESLGRPAPPLIEKRGIEIRPIAGLEFVSEPNGRLTEDFVMPESLERDQPKR